jgi:glycosyltransferase involved in cell wall biosynthesis
MRILFATDAFPPASGGSGWSTYELAKGLRERGHEIVIVQPAGSTDGGSRTHDGFQVIAFPYWAPGVPFARNYFKNERLTSRLGAFLVDLIKTRRIEILHAQHRLTGPAGILAAGRAGIPGVCTIRDYWPLCYWSDLLHDEAAEGFCPACTPGMMTRCVRPHAGAAWPLTLPMIPYMRANLSGKRRAISGARALVAVSGAVADLLRGRGPELSATRIDVIPNPVDVEAIRADGDRRTRPHPDPYVVYVGKLERNKGMAALKHVIEHARLDWPLVVVGDGVERAALEAVARGAGRDVRFTGWLSRDQAIGWLRHAAFVVFPSRWPEPLSRVLLEASALGVPVAAMDTGGTRDVIVDGVTGCLARDAAGLVDAVERLRRDEPLQARLGAAARQHVDRTFATAVVAEKIETLYRVLSLES